LTHSSTKTRDNRRRREAHLAGIASQAPTTLEELAGCTGIGPIKLERYGDEIVAVIAQL
jgi:superfamily II DNA helicase RecQ